MSKPMNVFLSLFFTLFLFSCGGGGGGGEDNPTNPAPVTKSLTRIDISADTAGNKARAEANPSTPLGISTQYLAIATYSDNSTADITDVASWISADSSIATIDEKGLVRTLKVSSIGISASYQGVTSNISTLTITDAIATKVSIIPPTTKLAKGLTLQLQAIATLSDDTTKDVSTQANWQSSWFANNLESWFYGKESPEWEALPAFSVTVATPADQYQLTDRAIKYAILLIALTFMAFFVFETLTGLRLHPMQYLLVGLSLVLFYLVLLALSEHVGFTPAWVVASLVGAAMNGMYLQAVLKSWKRSGLFVLALLGLDVVMWFLLRSEDSALLLGSAVLALALFAVMYLTRHFDWYSLSQPKRPEPPAASDNDTMRIWK